MECLGWGPLCMPRRSLYTTNGAFANTKGKILVIGVWLSHAALGPRCDIWWIMGRLINALNRSCSRVRAHAISRIGAAIRQIWDNHRIPKLALLVRIIRLMAQDTGIVARLFNRILSQTILPPIKFRRHKSPFLIRSKRCLWPFRFFYKHAVHLPV